MVVWLHLVCVGNYRWYGGTCSGEDELHEGARQEMGVRCREERRGNGRMQRGAEPWWRELCHAMRFWRGGEAEKRCGMALGFKPSKAVPGCWVSCTEAMRACDAPHSEAGNSERISMWKPEGLEQSYEWEMAAGACLVHTCQWTHWLVTDLLKSLNSQLLPWF